MVQTDEGYEPMEWEYEVILGPNRPEGDPLQKKIVIKAPTGLEAKKKAAEQDEAFAAGDVVVIPVGEDCPEHPEYIKRKAEEEQKAKAGLLKEVEEKIEAFVQTLSPEEQQLVKVLKDSTQRMVSQYMQTPRQDWVSPEQQQDWIELTGGFPGVEPPPWAAQAFRMPRFEGQPSSVDPTTFVPSAHERFAGSGEEGPPGTPVPPDLLIKEAEANEVLARKRAADLRRAGKIQAFKDVVAGGLYWLLGKIEGEVDMPRLKNGKGPLQFIPFEAKPAWGMAEKVGVPGEGF